jgi:Rad3-related DNA helicase
MSSEILKYWPIESPPRENQIKALQWLEKQTAKYVICQAPVGVGKSLIGITFSRYVDRGRGDSFVLTPQIVLQHQYEQSFDSNVVSSLYGKGNYKCEKRNTTCDVGSLVKPKCDSCPAVAARNRAKNSPNVVMNYKLAMLNFVFTQTFRKRKLLIMDECHNTENELTEFDAVQIFAKKCERENIPWKSHADIISAIDWVKSKYLPVMDKKLQELMNECEDLIDKGTNYDRHVLPTEITKLREMKALISHIDGLNDIIEEGDAEIIKNWCLVSDKQTIRFKRLFGAHSFKYIIEPMAERFLFMSATIVNPDSFCRDLGINPNDAAFYSLDSDFPAENRPVIYMPQMKMNVNWNSDENYTNRKDMINSIKKLMGVHKDQSGIIHTGNFAIAKWLIEELEDKIPHEIYHHNPDSGDNRNQIIQVFQSTKKPAVLISPSITEGLDLIDDLARFAIIVKTPYKNIGDQWVKARMELSSEWYQRQAIIDVIQGCGRIVRSKDDWGNVYILDQSWGYLYEKTKGMIPQWWKDAYHVIN